MLTMKTIFHTVCLAVLAVSLTGCERPLSAESDEYHILLEAWGGADHAKNAAAVKEAAERDGFKNLALVSKQNITELYMGRYPSVKAAEKDLQRAQTYKAAQWGEFYPFARARPMLVINEDIGPPEWNLLNAHPRYVYTVVVMTYHNEDSYVGRRQRAVDACRKLREQGEPAYFHHGPKNSSVCVGLFKINGIRVRMVDAPGGGGKVEQRIPAPEVQAVIKRYPRIYENDTHVRVAVPSTKQRTDVDTQGVRPPEGGFGSLDEFYAPSYPIDIPRRPSVRDPFAGFGNS